MTTYAITGGHGFLAWHLRCRLRAEQPEAEVRVLGRHDFIEQATLVAALDGCDAVFHLAAVNSHDAQAAALNIEIAEALVSGLDLLSTRPHVVFSNSTHADGRSAYGLAKRRAADILRRWATSSGGTLTDLMLPNLFGEMSKPHYNSAVATFCHAIVNGEPCQVNRNGRTELLHAQDAAQLLSAHATPNATPVVRVSGKVVGVGDLYDTLARFHDTYRGTQTVPQLQESFQLRLFNQLRTVMYPDAYPVTLKQHCDERGAFFEAARGFESTQTSFSTTLPGVTRGEHWHADKIERFLVLRGRGTIEIRRLFDDTVRTFEVSGDSPTFVDMPTLHAHNITNIGDDEMLTLFWANDHFSAHAPDTWPEPVRGCRSQDGERR